MISWHKLPAVFAVALAVSGAAQAKLMSVSDAGIEVQQQVWARNMRTSNVCFTVER